MKPRWWDDAARDLARRDPVMRRLVRRYPGASLKRRSDAFTALARAITGQQISVKAADAIWRRFVVLAAPAQATRAFPRLDPSAVAAVPVAGLRAAGYSERKAAYVADLAAHFASGRLDPVGWRALDDEALIAALVDVRGIGRWTAEMFLIFHELRPDVFPVDDLGVRKGVAVLYRRGAAMTPDEVRTFGERWRPWRSAATWYLWRSLDPVPLEY
ncbi:MAG TPA: DNA-3-methyladenine glycosylase 2 family protein [Casimicrobiaceae bacterium]|jgi:DNA-3-methyladenine glycosylase II|nr:DNA-3-methyladenine glycosylase 2 family protein [Casimicrobiaceae bacterium]